jgi:hypothetical protein
VTRSSKECGKRASSKAEWGEEEAEEVLEVDQEELDQGEEEEASAVVDR